MSKILFLDTYYPDVLKSLPKAQSFGEREEQLARLHFGTAYYYSKSFYEMGWEVKDIVVNDPESIYAADYVKWHHPNIIYFQDLNCIPDNLMALWQSQGIKLVAQHSCPWAGDDRIKKYDLVFTSFPHYIERIRKLGVISAFLPIAFGHWVLDYVNPTNRDIDISFVGGINGNSGAGHWKGGTSLLHAVANAFPSFKWWGYIVGGLDNNSRLAKAYQGPAWGLDQYKIYSRSKIVINRHGEVAEGYSNNMRMFEATGMGAALATEDSKNLEYYFNKNERISYKSEGDLICQIQFLLNDKPELLKNIGEAGQARTMRDHTYQKRLKEIEPILKGLIK